MRQTFSIVAALVVALLVLSQGIDAPFEKDAEPQSAQWVVDIVRDGNWLLPRDYYGFVDRKPPLFYWSAALIAKATGEKVDEVRARSVSLLSGAILAALIMAWGCESFGTVTGWLAFFFVLGAYAYASRATTALTDMLMTLLLFATYFVILPQLDGPPHRSRTAGAGVLLGLAFLAKGPVTLVLLAVAICLYLLMLRENPLRLLRRPWPWLMLIIAIAIAAAWYVPAALSGGGALIGVFIDENFGHFMPASLGGTGEAARPVYYIAMRIVGGALPLTCFIPALAVAFVNRDFGARQRRALISQLAMFLAVLILFSAASAKRDDYILPAMPALALMFAALFDDDAFAASRLDRNDKPLWITVRDATSALVAATMLAGVVGVILFARFGGPGSFGLRLQSSDASYAAIFLRGVAGMSLPFALFAAAVLTGSTLSFAGLYRRKSRWSGSGIAVLSLAGCLLWTAVLRPAEARTRSLSEFAAEVRSKVDHVPLYLAYDDPEFAWYYGRGVPALPHAIARYGAPDGRPVYFIARPNQLARLAPEVRSNLATVVRSHVLGGGGPPSLFILKHDSDLNPSPGSNK